MNRFLLTVGLFILGMKIPVYGNELIPLQVFTKFPQFQQLVISPTGEYLAAAVTKEDNTPLVTIIDVKNLQQLSAIEFKLGQLPSELTWLNNERLGIRISKKIGALDQPVGTAEYYVMNADGTDKEALWGILEKKRGQQGPAKYRTFMQILHLLPDDPKTILISVQGGSRGTASFTEAYELDIYSGNTKKVATAPIRAAYLLSDHNRNIRFAIGTDEDDDNKLKSYYRDSNEDEWYLSGTYAGDEGTITPIAFTPDNKEVYALSNLDASTIGLVKLKPNSDEPELIYRNEKVDLRDVFLSQDMQLVSAKISPDRTYNKTLTDHNLAQWLDKLQATFQDDTINITSATKDESKLIVYVSSAKDPGAYYLFNTQSKEMQFLVNSSPAVNPDKMSEVQPFTITSRDGIELSGYLTLPNSNQKNLPLVVYPHGGPHGPRDFWTFDRDAQMLASRGYAVLQLNFRGSGGYGREFEYSGYRKWGLEMQDDLTDATKWAIESGVADADRVCIYGASYGGYATLMGVVKEPDLYKCAIGYVGVYSLPMMFEEGDIPSSQSGINYLEQALGTDQEDLKKRSPAYNVDKIKAALFLVHGGKDERVPIEQAEFLMKQLDKRNYPYELLIKEKEGHGFYKEEHRLELYEKMLQFLEKHIGKA
ncbi:alpha/beta hydrolase family protein [Flavobacterium sp. W21_SRS_FM6]|uniref:alpha/beta hydrolase family protein n=1 Tax=Flavobacterium sp. W21_SRS_FM6 TaxID=3240268 RepID=UPI003F8EF559